MEKTVAVVSSTGKPLMPTSPYRARKLLKSGRAKIHCHRPVFTICILDREDGVTQPVEYKCDMGYQHIGISICSEKHEFVHEQRDTLSDEPDRHKSQKDYRRARRNRLRYRKPRFDNRVSKKRSTKKKPAGAKGKKNPKDAPAKPEEKAEAPEKWFAPTLRHKEDIHINLFLAYNKVFPITRAVFEGGKFDIRVLQAKEKGEEPPKGEEYQLGPRSGYDTLRKAVFARDGYECQICKRKNCILHVHHINYWRGDRSDRMDNLLTVCGTCKSPKNHKPGGKLYGLEPKLKSFRGAAFMNAVRMDAVARLRAQNIPGLDIRMTFGVDTDANRRMLGIEKTHANDAYAMGDFHPKHKCRERHFKKQRRNNRVLEKFRDARYIDIRDGKVKSGSELSCGRTRRWESRNSERNERVFRGRKVSKGSRPIRRRRYTIQPGDIVRYEGRVYKAKGCQSRGANVALVDGTKNGKSVSVKKITFVRHTNGWQEI